MGLTLTSGAKASLYLVIRQERGQTNKQESAKLLSFVAKNSKKVPKFADFNGQRGA